MSSTPTTLGLIVGNRSFFPAHLCETARSHLLKTLEEEQFRIVALDPTATSHGAIESLEDARKCADLFRSHRDGIDGVVVTLPNCGDERAIANALRWAELGVPVLIHAFDDAGARMTIADRRDSFCGKMAACNNLRQYGIPFSLTTLHTVDPDSLSFRVDLLRFGATCRVVRALKHARIGAIGARPASFNTVRYSEKLFEGAGISIETLDVSEVLGWTARMSDDDAAVKAKLDAIGGYTGVGGVPAASVIKMAKLGVAIDRWVVDKQLSATAIQCWTALEEFYGCAPCALMNMMSNSLLPSGCETDVAGVVAMYVLQAASQQPAALLDWNNNYGDDPDKGVVFHHEIIAGTLGKASTFGTIDGRVAPGPFTYCRVSTDDHGGTVAAYVGEGQFTDDPLETFGGYGVVEVPRFQDLLQFICRQGFEHHVAATRAMVADAVTDALDTYMDWDVYQHE